MKRLIRGLILGSKVIPEYQVVGIREQHRPVGASLRLGVSQFDVTHNNVVASLRPLRVAIVVPRGGSTLTRGTRAELSYHEPNAAAPALGVLKLTLVEIKPLAGEWLCLFEVRAAVNRCVSRRTSTAHYWYRWWAHRRRRVEYNHQMARRDLRSFYVLYTSPRPVALVTVQARERTNIFPMDLIGPCSPPSFLLALHSTSPSLGMVKEARRLAASFIPIELAQQVYALGKNHRVEAIDLSGFPLESVRSQHFELPVPASALSVLELELDEYHDLGSHTLLVTRIRSAQALRDGRRMCHIQGFLGEYLRRTGWRLDDSEDGRY